MSLLMLRALLGFQEGVSKTNPWVTAMGGSGGGAGNGSCYLHKRVVS